jgi:hypothetical protein
MALRLTLSVMIALIYAQISAGSEAQSAAVAALVKAYPDFMDRIEGKQLSAIAGTNRPSAHGSGDCGRYCRGAC